MGVRLTVGLAVPIAVAGLLAGFTLAGRVVERATVAPATSPAPEVRSSEGLIPCYAPESVAGVYAWGVDGAYRVRLDLTATGRYTLTVTGDYPAENPVPPRPTDATGHWRYANRRLVLRETPLPRKNGEYPVELVIPVPDGPFIPVDAADGQMLGNLLLPNAKVEEASYWSRFPCFVRLGWPESALPRDAPARRK